MNNVIREVNADAIENFILFVTTCEFYAMCDNLIISLCDDLYTFVVTNVMIGNFHNVRLVTLFACVSMNLAYLLMNLCEKEPAYRELKKDVSEKCKSSYPSVYEYIDLTYIVLVYRSYT